MHPQRFTFPRAMRLSGSRAFVAVYAAKARVSVGPLLVYGLPNDVHHLRLGLAVSRRIGNAVKRNAIKRRLREAFRLLQHDWNGDQQMNEVGTRLSYDLVISVRPHDPLSLAEYQQSLLTAVARMHSIWIKKQNKQTPKSGSNPEAQSNTE